jgi:hypothetical protein
MRPCCHHAVLVVLLATAGCRGGPAVDDCSDSLAGVWVGDGERFHLLDRGARLEIYPMDHEPAPRSGGVRQSPPAFELARAPSGITGRRYLRREQDGRICHVDLPAELRACADERITLAWRDLVHLRWVDCEVTRAPRFTERVLRRARYTPPRR